jgi:hypothetical protein
MHENIVIEGFADFFHGFLMIFKGFFNGFWTVFGRFFEDFFGSISGSVLYVNNNPKILMNT